MDLPTTIIERKALQLPDFKQLRSILNTATEPEVVVEIDNQLSGFEAYMKETGLYDPEEIRPLNETRMWARWKLGKLLADPKLRGHGGPGRGTEVSGLPSFKALIEKLGLAKPTAVEAQRIGAMPDDELEKVLARCHKEGDLCSFRDLVTVARPYWYQASRHAKHKTIQAKAIGTKQVLGPFPLIYADPPWTFATYSPKGLERTPTQHYPTMTDQEIMDFQVGDKSVEDIATKQAVLFLWCTSSNLHRALEVMKAWGFTFKTSAVWDKMRSGTGLVFRNQHEVLLYGTKGDMPGPRHQPRSVFRYPRGRHSAKPPQVRKAIEKMYPNFNAKTRLELFARDKVKGWTPYGNEAG